jgi:hypothetical protein
MLSKKHHEAKKDVATAMTLWEEKCTEMAKMEAMRAGTAETPVPGVEFRSR